MKRKVLLVNNEIYHIFNRGVNKADIYFQEPDFRRFYLSAIYYLDHSTKYSRHLSDPGSDMNGQGRNEQARVEVIAYCLLPNHFHFLMKQLKDGGITSYIRHLCNAYSHYINKKNDRVGPLFQGKFRSVHIGNSDQLYHVSRYIHLNPLVSKLTNNLENYKWSSYLTYARGSEDKLCNTDLILKSFSSGDEYCKFVLDRADYARRLDDIKHLVVE